jgi:hypothetical protein
MSTCGSCSPLVKTSSEEAEQWVLSIKQKADGRGR